MSLEVSTDKADGLTQQRPRFDSIKNIVMSNRLENLNYLVEAKEEDGEVWTLCAPPPTSLKNFPSSCRANEAIEEVKFERVAGSTEIASYQQEVVIFRDNDRRKEIMDNHIWPNSAHGYITIFSKEKHHIGGGSGTLIAPNLVLTCAHVVFDFKNKTQYNSFTFTPALCGEKRPFREINVRNVYYTKEYTSDKSEDYAVLVLEKPVGTTNRAFLVFMLPPQFTNFANKKATLIGYPSDKQGNKLYGCEGPLSHVDVHDDNIYYNSIDTYSGQSGSALFYEHDQNFYVFGVHIGSTKLEEGIYNRAIWITPKRYAQIKRWVREDIVKCVAREVQPHDRITLQDLCLNWCFISDLGAEILSNYNLLNLRSLDLHGCAITLEGAKSLSKTNWPSLTHLNLSGNDLGDEGVAALSKNTSWRLLEEMNLINVGFSTMGAKALASNETWLNLKRLILGWNEIDPEAAHALARNKSWTKLETLLLRYTEFNDKAAEALASNTSWPLTKLGLNDNPISCSGVNILLLSSNWPLQKIEVAGCNISEDQAKCLWMQYRVNIYERRCEFNR